MLRQRELWASLLPEQRAYWSTNPEIRTWMFSDVMLQVCMAEWLVWDSQQSPHHVPYAIKQPCRRGFWALSFSSRPACHSAADIWLWNSSCVFRDPLGGESRTCCFFFFFKLNYLNVCFYCMFFWTLKWSKHLVSPLLSVIWLHGLSWSAGVEYASISIFLELSW